MTLLLLSCRDMSVQMKVPMSVVMLSSSSSSPLSTDELGGRAEGAPVINRITIADVQMSPDKN